MATPKTTLPPPTDPLDTALASATEGLRRAQAEHAEATRALATNRDVTATHLEQTTSLLVDAPLNPRGRLDWPENRTYRVSPDDVLVARIHRPELELRHAKADLALRRAKASYDAALQAAQREAEALARPGLLSRYREIFDALCPVVEAYDRFQRECQALIARCPAAEGLVQTLTIPSLSIAASELPLMQAYLDREHANGGGGH